MSTKYDSWNLSRTGGSTFTIITFRYQPPTPSYTERKWRHSFPLAFWASYCICVHVCECASACMQVCACIQVCEYECRTCTIRKTNAIMRTFTEQSAVYVRWSLLWSVYGESRRQTNMNQRQYTWSNSCQTWHHSSTGGKGIVIWLIKRISSEVKTHTCTHTCILPHYWLQVHLYIHTYSLLTSWTQAQPLVIDAPVPLE